MGYFPDGLGPLSSHTVTLDQEGEYMNLLLAPSFLLSIFRNIKLPLTKLPVDEYFTLSTDYDTTGERKLTSSMPTAGLIYFPATATWKEQIFLRTISGTQPDEALKNIENGFVKILLN
jgi:hypothetical protein